MSCGPTTGSDTPAGGRDHTVAIDRRLVTPGRLPVTDGDLAARRTAPGLPRRGHSTGARRDTFGPTEPTRPASITAMPTTDAEQASRSAKKTTVADV